MCRSVKKKRRRKRRAATATIIIILHGFTTDHSFDVVPELVISSVDFLNCSFSWLFMLHIILFDVFFSLLQLDWLQNRLHIWTFIHLNDKLSFTFAFAVDRKKKQFAVRTCTRFDIFGDVIESLKVYSVFLFVVLFLLIPIITEWHHRHQFIAVIFFHISHKLRHNN